MRLPPLSAARCRITASISHKFFAAAGAVPPPYFKERRDDHARKKAERASLGGHFLADRLAACRDGTARGIPARRAAAPLSRILARAAHFAGGHGGVLVRHRHVEHAHSGRLLLSCALAVVLAGLSARFSRVKELLAPLVAAVKTVPVASFIILALIWLSSRTLPLFIAALMVFPPVYLNVLEGIRRTDASLLEMARVFRVPFSRTLRGVYLPQVLPYFRSAVSAALGLCWKAGTAAEVIALSSGSIGEKLYNAKIYFQTADLFAWTAAIVLISAAFEKLFLLLVDKIAERMGA